MRHGTRGRFGHSAFCQTAPRSGNLTFSRSSFQRKLNWLCHQIGGEMFFLFPSTQRQTGLPPAPKFERGDLPQTQTCQMMQRCTGFSFPFKRPPLLWPLLCAFGHRKRQVTGVAPGLQLDRRARARSLPPLKGYIGAS